MVGEAVGEDLADVGQELLLVAVLVLVHLRFDGAEIHRLLDLVQVVGHSVFHGSHGFAERSDQTRPKAYIAAVMLEDQVI